MKEESLSIVIPVYNSASILPKLLARLHPVLVRRGVPFEIVLVCDGSPDDSWEEISRLSDQWPEVRGIELMRNYGQHNALLCGIRAAKHSVIVTIDDDLQHPPEEIPAVLDRLAEGFDLVYGTPAEEKHGWTRDAASVTVKLALKQILGVEAAREVSAFRAFRTPLRDAFAAYGSPHVMIDVLLSWATVRCSSVKVRHEERKEGRSGYTYRRLIRHAVNLTVGFSTTPLRLANLLGFVVTLLGLAILVYVGGCYMVQGSSVPGFTFLACLIAIFSGVQLLCLGIIGEYLARIYTRMMDRPAYTVRSRVEKETALPADFRRGIAG
jgi:undecaprenyl-phosphate 4-deoxy-4-formamido-L-arabinose transferase